MNQYRTFGYEFAADERVSQLGALRDTYQFFESDEVTDPSIRVSDLQAAPTHAHRLGGSKRFYGRGDGRFTVRDHSSTVAVDADWTSIGCSEDVSTSTLTTMLEGEMRASLAPSGKAILHASAIEYEGETILFPAWRHTGKTNTMLSFAVRGAAFLSDDRLFVDEDGTAYSYPTPINLLQYNLRAFPELLDRTWTERATDKISLEIARHTEGMPEHSFVRGTLDYLNNHVIKDSYTLHPSVLFDGIEIPESTAADKVILLETTEEPIGHCRLEPLSDAELAQALMSITEYEWNSKLQQLYSGYDMLFPDRPAKTAQLESLRSAERDVYKRFSTDVSSFRLAVPEEEEWELETQERVVETTLNA